MKKILTVTALALTIGVGSFVVNADAPNIPNIVPGDRDSQYSREDREQWNRERREIQKDRIQRYVEEGRMTEAEAKKWEEHYEYMENFHNENGYMQGGCHGGRSSGMGHMGGGMMRGAGMGHMNGGMMRGSRL